MSAGLRVAIASQTPYVRMKRDLPALEAEYGPFDAEVPLDKLRRSVDYSVTPGGVARMIGAVAERVGLEGDWVALDNGFPRDLRLGGLRLAFARLPDEAKRGYGEFKEVAWEAMNGLPPRVAAPLSATGAWAAYRADYEAWAQASTRRLLALEVESPFDVYYVNDWQQLPQGHLLRGRSTVMHFHAPFAEWSPPGWRDFMLHHLRAFDAVIVSTNEFAQALHRAGFERPVHQVYPWLNPEDYPAVSPGDVRAFEARWGLSSDDEVVLHVGRMDPVKAQDALVRAFALLAQRRPRAKLVLVGNGSFSSSSKGGIGLSKGKKWRAHLEALVAELGLQDRVVFTGHLPHADVLAALQRADAFAFPSAGEGFGLAIVEAWLYGKPVVTSARAGVRELIEEGVNGLVWWSRDPADLAEALHRLLAVPDEARAMGENGRKTALAHCDVQHAAPRVLDVLLAHASRHEPASAREVARRARSG